MLTEVNDEQSEKQFSGTSYNKGKLILLSFVQWEKQYDPSCLTEGKSKLIKAAQYLKAYSPISSKNWQFMVSN